MEETITFQKSGIDRDVERLIAKLEPHYPTLKVLEEIAAGYATPFKVMGERFGYGLLLCRRVRNYQGQEILVIDHAIAEDGLDTNFSTILSKSLFAWGHKLGFAFIHQHADRPGLARMLEREYGQASEWIFKKDLNQWAKGLPHLKQARPQPQPQRT